MTLGLHTCLDDNLAYNLIGIFSRLLGHRRLVLSWKHAVSAIRTTFRASVPCEAAHYGLS